MALSPDEQTVLDELGSEIGTSVLASMRPYSVACPESICKAPLGTACGAGSGIVREEPHMSRVRLATRRHGSI